MPELAPDTRTRVALTELAGVSLMGDPGQAAVSYLSDGSTATWETSEALALKSCPDLLTITWEYNGLSVSAEIDLVATRYCTLDEIREYRPNEYCLTETSDADAWNARARAEATIEGAAYRFFQPVMRTATVTRRNCCTTGAAAVDGDKRAYDIQKVVNGSKVSKGSSPTVLNVIDLPLHESEEVALVLGMPHTPIEVHDAVRALACWYLVPSAGPENATSTSTDAGVLRFVVGGVDGAETSLPEVNAVISRYGFPNLLIG